MAEFCVHERHGGICEKTGTYCNLGACPYEDLQKFAPVASAGGAGRRSEHGENDRKGAEGGWT